MIAFFCYCFDSKYNIHKEILLTESMFGTSIINKR